MFGFYATLNCPFCGKEYSESYGITAFYKINDKEYLEEECPHCKTKYYRPSNSLIPDDNTAGSIRASDLTEQPVVNSVCCF